MKRPSSFRLFDIQNPNEEMVLVSDIRLGSDSQNDWILASSSVSDFHAKIIVEEGCLTLVDLHSENGTFLNNERIYRAPLQAGDKVRLGQHTLVLDKREGLELDQTLVGSHMYHLNNSAESSDSGKTLLDRRVDRGIDMAMDVDIDETGHITDSGVKLDSMGRMFQKTPVMSSNKRALPRRRISHTWKVALWSHLATVSTGMLLYGLFLFNL